MSAPDSPRSPKSRARIRRDGWTADRQLQFLDALAQTRSVRKAAAFAGMSREGAYRLRNRREGALFAALWDRVFEPDALGLTKVHSAALSDGRLARLLGNHFRRNSGDNRFGRPGRTQ